MADVTISYKGSPIAEMNESGIKTLNTKGSYCEDDIVVSYQSNSSASDAVDTNSKTYEITLTKSAGWVLLTSLDEEVLEHINDASLVVSLARTSEYVYCQYASTLFIAANTPFGYSGSYPAYGMVSVELSGTSNKMTQMYYPPNKTDTDIGLGGGGMFRVSDGNYYARSYDAYIGAGTYKLTFTW